MKKTDVESMKNKGLSVKVGAGYSGMGVNV